MDGLYTCYTVARERDNRFWRFAEIYIALADRVPRLFTTDNRDKNHDEFPNCQMSAELPANAERVDTFWGET